MTPKITSGFAHALKPNYCYPVMDVYRIPKGINIKYVYVYCIHESFQ